METQEEKAADIAISETRKAMEKAGFSFLKIAKELAILSFSDISDYMVVSKGGAIEALPLDTLKRNKSRAVKKIREKTTIKESSDGQSIFKESTLEYELHDKTNNLQFSAALMGMKMPERHIIDIEGSLMAAVAARLGNVDKPVDNTIHQPQRKKPNG